MLRTIYKDDERYVKTYWSKWNKNIYFAGDGVKRDEDGYFWFTGRVDDVIKLSGHRIGTAEVESALVDHPAVAEAAVVGVRDAVGLVRPVGYLVLRAGAVPSPQLAREILNDVRQGLLSYKCPQEIHFLAELPKTATGKIQRFRLRQPLASEKS